MRKEPEQVTSGSFFNVQLLDGPAEMPVMGMLHELLKCRTANMNKIGMIAGFKVYIGASFQTVVHHHIHVIRLTNGGDCA